MTSSFVATVLLYLSIIATSLLLRERKLHIFGVISVASCLLFIELPDIPGYKDHYQLVERTSLEYIFSLNNFEPGYVVAVAFLSKFLPFEAFYVIAISLAIYAYIKFYKNNIGSKPYIFALFFLSMHLYFIAIPLRTTIASIFLAYSLLYLKNNKNALAAALIIIGSTFHIAITPMLVLPILNNFSGLITRYYLLVLSVAIAASIIISRYLSLDSFVDANDYFNLKISAYEDANVSSSSIYFKFWILAILGSYISSEVLSEFDRVLVTGMTVIIILLQPFEFIQGRFMWLTSFLFVYIFVKVILSRVDVGGVGRLIFVATLPLIIFLRF